MDIIDRHFAAENAHDVDATLATYTDDIVWDDVTHPLSPFEGKDAVGSVYSGILDAIPDVHLGSVKRLTSPDGTFVVDESILTGHVEGSWSGVEGGGAPVRVRIRRCF
jgi:ketosteroid isomerase-like protein